MTVVDERSSMLHDIQISGVNFDVPVEFMQSIPNIEVWHNGSVLSFRFMEVVAMPRVDFSPHVSNILNIAGHFIADEIGYELPYGFIFTAGNSSIFDQMLQYENAVSQDMFSAMAIAPREGGVAFVLSYIFGSVAIAFTLIFARYFIKYLTKSAKLKTVQAH